MERWAHKLLALAALFIVMAVCILLPIKLSASVQRMGKKGKTILSTLSCFGGGVFFGAYLLHMTPDVIDIIGETILEPNNISYPIGELIIGLGFFLILFIEKFILCARDASDADDNQDAVTTVCAASYVNDAFGPAEATEGHDVVGRFFPPVPIRNDQGKVGGDDLGRLEEQEQTTKSMNGTATATAPASAAPVTNGKVPGKDNKESDADAHSHGGQGAAAMRSAIFIVALSLDCIFEGLSLGLKRYSTDVWNMFAAIIGHEFVVSFCLGMELVKHHPTKKVVAIGVFYALTPAMGGIIGIVISEASSGANQHTIDIVNGVLQGLCAGTFIYCTFIGILAEELTHGAGVSKAFAVIVGFGLMAGLKAIPNNDTPESDDESLTTMRALTAVYL